MYKLIIQPGHLIQGISPCWKAFTVELLEIIPWQSDAIRKVGMRIKDKSEFAK